MKKIKEYNEKIFEQIKHIDENGNEYWEARELQKVLEYNKWENFHKVIKKAMTACELSNHKLEDCFPEVRKSIFSGKGRKTLIIDYKLSRYACYLIVQNGDSKKKVVALGQTYFAIQTRKQEILEENIQSLSENQKRLKIRNQVRIENRSLNSTVYDIGARTKKRILYFS